MIECVWCTVPVEEDGDTCGYDCYVSYYAWIMMLHNKSNDDVVRLQPDERPPKPMYLQPWYIREAELEDYL